MDPLVEEYLRKKQGLDQGVADARTKADWMDAGSQVGQGLADLVQPKNQVIYEKGWNETGAPKIENFSNKAADFSGLKTMGQRDLQAAQENRNQGVQDFNTEQKLTDLGTERTRAATKFGNDQELFKSQMADSEQMRIQRGQGITQTATDNDAKSSGSRALQNLVKSEMPSMDPAVIDSMSAAQISKNLPWIVDKWQLLNKPKESKASDPRVVERLGKDTEEKGGIINAFNQVEALLGQPLQTGLKGQKDVPGVTLPILGSITSYSPEAKQLDSAIGAITNEISRTNFGASQSAGELKRLARELSTGRFNTEAERMDALARMKNLYAQALQDTQVKYPQEARDTYKAQGGMIGAEIPRAQPTTTSKSRPPGVRVLRNKNTGAVKYVDAQGNEVPQ